MTNLSLFILLFLYPLRFPDKIMTIIKQLIEFMNDSITLASSKNKDSKLTHYSHDC
ncbi:MAG: hypothetical protein OQK98_00840 [Gammaproteobacteria bacterium]|nr:hypothetical protein [Gammaproteobacteria bacterium]